MRETPNSINRAILIGFVLIVAGLVLVESTFGQTIGGNSTTSPERGTSHAGRSFSLSDIETIGNYSGNVMFNVPLGSLPSGRGGLKAGLSLHYDSKIWDMKTLEVLESTVTNHDKNILLPSEEGNWSYNYSYRLKLDNMVLGANDGFCSNGNNNPWKLNIVLPDGSKHALFLDGHTNSEGFMDVLPDGRTACPTGSSPSTITSTFRYFSTDGTYLRLDILPDSDSPSYTNSGDWGSAWINNTWILYMPDGTRVYGNPDTSDTTIANRIIDRNGNSIDIVEKSTDSSYSNHRTTSIKDQLGRSIVIEYSSATDQDSIHSPGFNGTDIITKVKWKNIEVNKAYYACDYNPVGNPVDNHNFPLNESLRVVDQVLLPVQFGDPSIDDLYYTFAYNADNTSAADTGWGEVSRVTLPSGAYSDYSYYYDGASGSSVYPENLILNRPTQKDLHYSETYDGSSTSKTDTWTYSPLPTNASPPNITGLTITGPDGGAYSENYAFDSNVSGTTIPQHVKGEIYKSVSADGSIIEKYYTSNTPLNAYQTHANRFVKYAFVSPKDASGNYPKTAITEYKYDKNGNLTESRDYDYVTYSTVPRNSNDEPTGLPSGATPARITKTEYYNDTPDSASTTYSDTDSYWLASSPRLLNLVYSMEVQDSSGNPKSRSEITYDYTDYSSSNTKAGNPTETKVWDSYKGGSSQAYSNPLTSTNSITTSATYNAYGMPLTTTDANDIHTQITYADVTVGGSSVTGPYPTQTIVAYGTSLARTSTAVYDFTSGLVTSATDVDNDLTNATEYDVLGRPTKSITAQGTTFESSTTTEYHDADRFVVVKSDLETKDDGRKVATQFYDQLGRVRLSKTLEDASTQSATNETDGIKVQTRYATTNSGGTGYTYQLTSNPYRADFSYNAGSETTMGWTRSKALNTGRHSEVETFSGSALPQPFVSSGYNTASTGVAQTDVDASATTVTDQAGKVRRSITNGLGQLVRVDEPTSSGLGTVASPNQATSYAYDTLNNLTTVTQGGQTRTFTYSSLSRLLTAANPESGTISYGYDPNGNLTSKVDARSITTSYSYDYLNRVTQRSYSGGSITTPTVNYTYGLTAPAVGKLTKVESSVSTTEYTGFDILGRVTAAKQTTDGGDSAGYTTGYTYNLSGALDTETYPSGRVVKNVLDANGDLSIVESKKNSAAGYWHYADSFTYNAAGAVTSMQLGNGRWESTVFNSRLQPTQIALGTTNAATDLLKLNYTYGVVESGTLNTAKNDGNIQSQTITVPNVGSNTGFAAVQTYSYDELNRIQDAVENVTPTGGSSSQSWKQTFTFDRYGNRNFDEANTTTLPKNCGTSPNFTVCAADKKIYDPAVDAGSNRLSTGDGYAFDDSGNTTGDAEGRTFVYDAENKQTTVSDANGVIGQYWYDGDGRRVKKYVPATGELTVFVYDAGGKSVAEYSTIVETANAQVAYLTADHLGSPRINTDANGAVISRHDYHPFGEEIDGTGGRTTGLNYGDDAVRKQFTGYERDGETGLDFAEARNYSSAKGRFNVSDPLLSSSEIADPKSWNRFAYVSNNPMRYVDPTGLYRWSAALGGDKTDEELLKEEGGNEIVEMRKNFRGALLSDWLSAQMLTDERDRGNVLDAIHAYGAEGERNGVIVDNGTGSDPRHNGETHVEARLVTRNETKQLAYRITVTLGLTKLTSDLMVQLAHEGRHVFNAKNWVKTLQGDVQNGLTNVNSSLANLTRRDNETDAYITGALTAQAIGITGNPNDYAFGTFTIWKKGWRAPDKAAVRGLLNHNYTEKELEMRYGDAK